jgi:transposase InsO family protein
MAFVDVQRAEGHAVESICRVLSEQGCQVAARTYRAWRSPTRAIASRTYGDAIIIDAIRTLCATTGLDGQPRATPESLYGRRKMTALLRRNGYPQVARCTVDRAMKALGMNGIRRAKGVRTTIPRAGDARAPDLLHRNFTAPAPNHVWVADFTVVRAWAGLVYIAFIVDVFAQRIVAWHAMTSKVTDLVLTPVRMALWDRDRTGHPVVPGQLVSHSDAGSQYTSIRFTEHLALEGIAPSIGTVGDALDNGLMESVIGLYKTECIRTTIFHDGPYKTIADVEYATTGWVDWYNQRRLHGSLQMLTPIEFERTHYATLNREPQPT